MLSAAHIIAALDRHGVTHVLGVPDNGSCALYERLWDHDPIEVILTSREGEAFGLASGLYLGGAHPLVLIQNTGFLEDECLSCTPGIKQLHTLVAHLA